MAKDRLKQQIRKSQQSDGWEIIGELMFGLFLLGGTLMMAWLAYAH